MITADQFSVLRVYVFAVRFALRLDFLIVGRFRDRTRHKGPVIAPGVVEAHPQTRLAYGGCQISDQVARGMAAIGREMGIFYCARPQRESVVMLGRKHDVFRAAIMKDLGPRV